jgi:hypothetical protein
MLHARAHFIFHKIWPRGARQDDAVPSVVGSVLPGTARTTGPTGKNYSRERWHICAVVSLPFQVTLDVT